VGNVINKKNTSFEEVFLQLFMKGICEVEVVIAKAIISA